MDEGENSENSDEVERLLLAGCTLRIPFQIIPLHSLPPSVKQSNGDCISTREGKRGNLTTPIRVAWRGLNSATSRGCCCHGEENQSEAQIGSVVVFKTLHHCGLGGGEGGGDVAARDCGFHWSNRAEQFKSAVCACYCYYHIFCIWMPSGWSFFPISRSP